MTGAPDGDRPQGDRGPAPRAAWLLLGTMLVVLTVVLGWERSRRVLEEQLPWILVSGVAAFAADLALRRAAGPLRRLAAQRRRPVALAGWALFLGSPLLLYTTLDAPESPAKSAVIVLVLAGAITGLHLLMHARR